MKTTEEQKEDARRGVAQMNSEVKKLWVDSLLSGEYTQGHERLRTPMTEGGYAYCCLGVLCDLADQDPDVDFSWSDIGVADKPSKYANFYPPAPVREWAGLPADNPFVKYEEDVKPLAHINDEAGRSFGFIANLISVNL